MHNILLAVTACKWPIYLWCSTDKKAKDCGVSHMGVMVMVCEGDLQGFNP